MNREAFQQHLDEATETIICGTRTFVTNELPSDYLYLISHNEGFNPSVTDGQSFPEDARYKGVYVGPLDSPGVTDHLWRNGKVPRWINIIVHTADDHHTFFLLRCSGCFSAVEDFDHKDRPIPFNLRLPPPPPDWRVKAINGTIDLKKSLEMNGKYHMPENKEVLSCDLMP
jgi:hypothetical protein